MNVEYSYQADASTTVNVESPVICQEICQNNPSFCLVWTYVSLERKCRMMSKLVTKWDNDNMISGPNFCPRDYNYNKNNTKAEAFHSVQSYKISFFSADGYSIRKYTTNDLQYEWVKNVHLERIDSSSKTEEQKSQSCPCSVSNEILTCNSNTIKVFPTDLENLCPSLNLNHGIHTIDMKDQENVKIKVSNVQNTYPSVEKLILNATNLKSIDDGALDPFINLEELYSSE